MKGRIIEKASVISDVLFMFGDSFNLTKLNRMDDQELFISNDAKAISQDWIAVGKEVDSAIARYEREIGTNKPNEKFFIL